MVLTNSQYDEIMREYSAKQDKSRHELEYKTANVFLKVPQYKQLLDQVSAISVEAVKASLAGNTNACKELSDQISAIEEKLSMLLTGAGFPSDYLTPKFECDKCQDTGFIGNDKCSCFKQASINLLYKQSNLDAILEKENFSYFSFDYYSDQYINETNGLTPLDNMKKIVKICMDFIKNFPSGANLLFYGDTGVGKTFLSNCIAKELLDDSRSVIYLSAPDLFNYFSKNGDNPNDEMSSTQIMSCDLLIIDDLGTELTNAYTNSKLFQVINNRLLEQRSTIISTNFALQDLMNIYSERIFSRISSSYELLKFFGDDIRIHKNI